MNIEQYLIAEALEAWRRLIRRRYPVRPCDRLRLEAAMHANHAEAFRALEA